MAVYIEKNCMENNKNNKNDNKSTNTWNINTI